MTENTPTSSLPPIAFYNTLTRKVEDLTTLEPGLVKMYCCGPTVYNYQHIGNLRTYIFEDLLTRTLRFAGYTVKHVMNITDVGHLSSDADEGEDKMALASRREGRSSREIADYYTDIFFRDCEKLNIIRPNVISKATDHIPQMIDLISNLEKKGLAYVSGGNVYFDVEQFPQYGQLAMLDVCSLKAGARIAIDDQKRSPHDFVLWFTQSKFENQELQWDSPWGRGYPGWHIECSAMAMCYLGEAIDIHCGGIDHIPVHHTNEIAQSEGASGKQFARYWLHGAFLTTDKEKMSKSKGEFLKLELLESKGFEPLSYRYLCLSAHYRRELSWSWEAITTASQSLARLRSQVLDIASQVGNSVKALETVDADVNTEANTADSTVNGTVDGTVDGTELLRNTLTRDNATADYTANYTADYIGAFEQALYHDLSLPRALAVLHKVVNDKKLAAQKKLTLIYTFDRVCGLDLEKWVNKKFSGDKLSENSDISLPAEVTLLMREREEARRNRNWAMADELRDKLLNLGYQVIDGKSGMQIKKVL